MRVKKDDTVVVIAGKDKGKKGKVVAVLPKQNRVVVEGVNIMTKHQKPTAVNPQGGIINKEAPIHISDRKSTRLNSSHPSSSRMPSSA